MKLHTQLIALSDYASISRENKLSISGIFDELRVNTLPGGIAKAYLVAMLVGSPDTLYKLTLKLELGKKIINTSELAASTGSNGKANMVIDFNNLGFEKEGDYRFILYEGDHEIGTTELKVIHVQSKQQSSFKLPN